VLQASDGPGTAAAAEPAGGAPDDDAAARFPGYATFDPEKFDDVEDAAGAGLQEEDAEEGEEGERERSRDRESEGNAVDAGGDTTAGEKHAGLNLPVIGQLAVHMLGEELLGKKYLESDEAKDGGSIDGTGFGRETLGPEDFLPKEDAEYTRRYTPGARLGRYEDEGEVEDDTDDTVDEDEDET
jgi:hypothetical protein